MQGSIQNQRDEQALANILAAIIIGLYLTNVMVGIGRFFGLTPSIVSLTSKILILGTIARCAAIFIYRINFAMTLTTYIFLLMTVIQQVFFPENRQYLLGSGDFLNSTFFVFLLTVLPAVYTISVIQDFDILLKRLQDTGILISVCTLLILLAFGGEAFEKYCMGFAGAMILPTCTTITRAADDKQPCLLRRGAAMLAVVDVFTVAMFGSRGGFIAIVAFMLYYFLWEQIRQRKIVVILESVGILCLAGNYKKVLKTANDLALNMGFYSRTLMSLSSEKVDDSGRGSLYDVIKRDILEHPLQIRGINSDYEAVGWYCHNWFLEVLHAFGLLVGGLFCIVIIYLICQILWRGRKNARSIIQICLTFAFFPVCLVSGSIWLSTWFWTWLALCFLPEYDQKKTDFNDNGKGFHEKNTHQFCG